MNARRLPANFSGPSGSRTVVGGANAAKRGLASVWRADMRYADRSPPPAGQRFPGVLSLSRVGHQIRKKDIECFSKLD